MIRQKKRFQHKLILLSSGSAPQYYTNLSKLALGASPPGLTRTNTSDETYFDASGSLQYPPSNQFTYSELPTGNWGFGQTTTGSTVTAANGVTLTLVQEDSTTNTHNAAPSFTGSFVTGATYIFQVVARKTANNNMFIFAGLGLAGANTFPWFDLNLGTSGVGGTVGTAVTGIVALGGGDYLCWLKWTATNTPNPSFYLSNASSGPISATPNYAGRGAGFGIYLGGAQVSIVTPAAAGPLAYNKTTSAAFYGPFVDYDPATLAPLGWRKEPAATNLITNSALIGGNASTPPTGGTFGSTRAVTLSYAYGTESGMPYMDVTFSWTAVAANEYVEFRPVGVGGLTVVNGSSYTGQIFLALPSGALTNATAKWVVLSSYVSPNPTLTASLTKFTSTATASGTTATPSVGVYSNAAGAVSGVLRVGYFGVELGSFATSPILTYGAAVTRNEPTIAFNGVPLSMLKGSAATIAYTAKLIALPSTNVRGFSADNGATEQYRVAQNTTTVPAGFLGTTPIGTTSSGDITTAFRRAVLGFSGSTATLAYDSTVGSPTAGTAPSGVVNAYLGASPLASGKAWAGWFSEIGIWTSNLPDSTKKAFSTSGRAWI